VFGLHESRYAVDSRAVREIFALPDLNQVIGGPRCIRGLLNLRGRVVPVMDLSVRFGQAPARPRLSDSVVVVEEAGHWLGMIVSALHDVTPISTVAMEALPAALTTGGAAPFLSGVARLDQRVVSLLDIPALVDLAQSGDPAFPEEDEDLAPASAFAEATAEEQAVFQERARSLMELPEAQDLHGLTPLAVVGLGGEYFGVRLEEVREFAKLGDVTPVPCCPRRIAGLINIRGEILTLLDIRESLRVPVKERGRQVVVVQVEALRAGIVVDEVVDVIYVRPGELEAIPFAMKSVQDEALTGTAPYADRLLTVVDLSALLREEDWVVNEEA
jgi:purine-binding chemotaxis protein CheW